MGNIKPEEMSDEVWAALKAAKKVTPATEEEKRAIELRGD
jgi:hypothetical protein